MKRPRYTKRLEIDEDLLYYYGVLSRVLKNSLKQHRIIISRVLEDLDNLLPRTTFSGSISDWLDCKLIGIEIYMSLILIYNHRLKSQK